ncbi:UdgX family uracil-DNA binding protein [Roseobacteraceae bacterium NS-SX3]
MQLVSLPRTGTAAAWRAAARGLLAAGAPPEEIRWSEDGGEAGLFDTSSPIPAPDRPVRVPRSFAALAETVAWHRDSDRFDRLYAFLWRLKEAPHLMADRGDPQLAHLRRMEKSVQRCQHKMKAFVRFRETGDPAAARRSFAAWFEPEHHSVEPTAGFFARRFADMDWRILTPDVSAVFEASVLRLEPGAPRPGLPADASEALWLTYFSNIFNPARLKVKAMQSEMPRKYWRNLPEAAAIPGLIATAPARARAMAEAAPTLPPARTARVLAAAARQAADHWQGPQDGLGAALAACTRCPLHAQATQAVPGEGPRNARLMVVGEQPGDAEDLLGRPFAGPAGKLFGEIATEAGLRREEMYLTNAVKHFKFRPRGRRRLHQRPNAGEVQQCQWWLDAEAALIRPRLIVAMGATAALALTGSGAGITARRGRLETGRHGGQVLMTLHPAHILRLPDAAAQKQARDWLHKDLCQARQATALPEQQACGRSQE